MAISHSLVLGGASSGKSAYAEAQASTYSGRPLYLATAEARDAEMTRKIANHQARRGPEWDLAECPLELSAYLLGGAKGASPGVILVDCLTLWLSNLLEAKRDVHGEITKLCRAAKRCETPVIFVSNEIGLGLVPEGKLSRAFRDFHGQMNREVASVVDHVVFVAAGLPLVLKDHRQQD